MQIFKTGGPLYIELPGGNGDRRLHRGTVAESSEDRVCVVMKDLRLGIDSGIDVSIYYDLEGSFVRQPAEVSHVERAEATLRVELDATGDSEGADGREHGRANTLRDSLSIWVEGGEICRVADVSCTGLSMLSRERLSIGEDRRVRLVLDEMPYEGLVVVRSAAPLGLGITRYGVEIVESSPGNLAEGFSLLSEAPES